MRTMPNTQVCHVDEFGLIDLACLRTLLDAESRAYARGYTRGRQDVLEELAEDARAAVRSAATGQPRHPWKISAPPEDLAADAQRAVAAERDRFRAGYASGRQKAGW